MSVCTTYDKLMEEGVGNEVTPEDVLCIKKNICIFLFKVLSRYSFGKQRRMKINELNYILFRIYVIFLGHLCFGLIFHFFMHFLYLFLISLKIIIKCMTICI